MLGLVAFGLALLVQEARPGVGVFRTVFFLPAAVGLASASLLFYAFFNDATVAAERARAMARIRQRRLARHARERALLHGAA